LTYNALYTLTSLHRGTDWNGVSKHPIYEGRLCLTNKQTRLLSSAMKHGKFYVVPVFAYTMHPIWLSGELHAWGFR